VENSKLPREHRRPAPKKPQIIGGGAGNMNEAAAASARGMLVPCRNCGRQFASDRIGVHERICMKGAAPPPRAGGSGPMGSTGMPSNSQTRCDINIY